MKKKVALLFLSICMIIQSFACDYDIKPFLWWYFKSDLICSGRVIKVFESNTFKYDINFLVDRVYKGEAKDTIRLTVKSYHEKNATISDCDVYMRVGENWLIYLKKENGRYFTGGQESRTNKVSFFEKVHPKEFDWLGNANFKVTDFYWNWNEWDSAPQPKKINSIVSENFNVQTVDTSSVFGNSAFILCDVDKSGKLLKSNLFYYPKSFTDKTFRIIFGKHEYLNPEVECFTNFQKEAVRVAKLIKNWNPAFFCEQQVNSQVLLKFWYENGIIKVEIR